MSVPFCMGKIIDIIYNSSQDTAQMVETLSYVCKILCGVFLVGGAANFGRVYLIQISGEKRTSLLFLYKCVAGLSKCAGRRQFCPLQSITCRLLHTGLHKEPSSGQGDLAFAAYYFYTHFTPSVFSRKYTKRLSYEPHPQNLLTGLVLPFSYSSVTLLVK